MQVQLKAYNTITMKKDKGWDHSNLSLSQVGTLPFHCPSAWHVLSAGPFSVDPVSHEYLAASPKEVPALVSTRPLMGSPSWPQETPAVINQRM